nr:putative ribonuclease H-like domain-containing protein [Tanacetum cinerariifolium]
MHKAFPLLVRKFPLPEGTSHCLKKNATARRKVMPLPKDYTAVIIKKKLSVKDDSFLKISTPCPALYSSSNQHPDLSFQQVVSETPSLDNILTLSNQFKDTLGGTINSEESNGVEADVSNLEVSITASPTPTLRIHKDHPKSQIIGPVDTLIQTRNKSKEKIFDALQDPSWVEAMQEELLQFKIQNVWTLVDCPKGVRPIGTKWVLKNKKDERGIVIKNKARLVAHGHTQEEGIDYDEVYAPVARIEAIRLFLAYASFMDFVVYQMDVKSDFLYGTIDEEVLNMTLEAFSREFSTSILHLSDSEQRTHEFIHIYLAFAKKGEHNSDFHPMVDFLEASSLRRNLKLRDKDGIRSLLDAELFEKLTLMGYNISQNQKFTFQKGHYTSLWNQFNDVKNMLGHGGFSWDVTRHMVVADDYVWETYVKEKCIINAFNANMGRPVGSPSKPVGSPPEPPELPEPPKPDPAGALMQPVRVVHGLQDKAFKELAAAMPLSISARVESLDGNRNPASAKFCSELHIPGLNVPLNFALITSMQVVSSSSVNWFHSMHRTSSSISACTARTSSHAVAAEAKYEADGQVL